MKIEQRGMVIGPAECLDVLPSAAFKVPDWRGKRMPRSQAATDAAILAQGSGWQSCTAFDDNAARGCRHVLRVYRTAEEHAAIVQYESRRA